MNKHLRRSVAALATAFACLVLMASPSSADTHDAVITGGTITAIGTGTTFTTTLGGTGGGTGCTSSITAASDHAAGTAEITGFSSVGRFLLGGTHYISSITRVGSTAGTASSGSINSATLTVQVDVFLAANPSSTATDCATSGTRRCRFVVALHFTGTYTSTSSSLETSSNVTLSTSTASTIVVTPPCQTPFIAFNGGTATVANLTAHITTTTP